MTNIEKDNANMLIAKIIDGKLRVCLPNGEPIGGEIMCKVTDEVGEPTVAIIKCYVKIE